MDEQQNARMQLERAALADLRFERSTGTVLCEKHLSERPGSTRVGFQTMSTAQVDWARRTLCGVGMEDGEPLCEKCRSLARAASALQKKGDLP